MTLASPARSYEQAYACHHQGRLVDAERHYQAALAAQPAHFGALYGLGIIRLGEGRFDETIRLLRKALKQNPRSPEAQASLADALYALKRFDEAVKHYERALALKPDFPEVQNGLAHALRALGRDEAAVAHYEQALALRHDFHEARFNLGNALFALNRLAEASARYEEVLSQRPDHLEARYNLACILQRVERFDEAVPHYERVLARDPRHAGAHNNLGYILQLRRRHKEALAHFRHALAAAPDLAEAHTNFGRSLTELSHPEEALACHRRALELKPDCAAAYSNQGSALALLKRPDEALASFDKALALEPNHAEAYNNRGFVLQDLRRLEEALESFDKAAELKPDQAACFNKSLLLILMGRYREGWELYESRFNLYDLKSSYYTFPQLAWRGQSDIGDKKILIYTEQGFGDVIQFCRYLPRVKERAAEIIVEVRESLVSFIGTLDCPMTVIAKGTPLPDFDAYCPIMSLPYAFKTTVETIPAAAPYLFSDKNKVEQWRQKLGARDKLKVGLAWSGSAGHKNDANRSIRLADLVPLIDLPIEWHSLQKEYREHDLAVLQQHPEIHQHQNDLQDFSDTAALIDGMDLVISVDSVIAHAAGALGKPVWILLPFMPDFRWLLDRDDTPWYPTARLFRQPRIGDWHSAIKMVAENLDSTQVPRTSA